MEALERVGDGKFSISLKNKIKSKVILKISIA